jgi:bla regulator protein blaR1
MTYRIAHTKHSTRKLSLAVVAAALAGILSAPHSQAQSAPARAEFEVASLKSNTSGVPGYSIRPLPGGLTARNINLKRLIAVAYSVTDYQIFGSLSWLESARFDLEAKSPGPAQLPQLRPMVQSMLDDRFKLKIHRDTRELPIYSLTLARSGVKGGPGLVESAAGACDPVTAQSPPSAAACGAVNAPPGRISGQRGRISQLADRLATILGRTVVDKTGLDGIFDIQLSYTPDPDMTPQLPPGLPASDVPGPSLFTAMQEQLGLKLVAGKGPVEVIVVDSAEKPTEN